MNSRYTVITILIIVIIGAAVFTTMIAWPFTDGRYDNLLYIAPKTAEMKELNGVKLEELNGDALIVSYEILSNARVGALNAHYDCVLVGTNYTYNYLFSHILASGGFFTKDAQEQGRAVAVLGLTAANAMFGGSDVYGKNINVNHNNYTVIGVIDDGADDEKRIYIPVNFSQNQDSLTAGPGDSNGPGNRPGNQGGPSAAGPVFVMASTAGVSADYVKNEMKAVGISDRSYYFAPIGILAGLVGKTPVNVLKLIAIILSAIILIGLIRIFRKNLYIVLQRSREAYFLHVLRHSTGTVLRFLCSLTALLASVILIIYIANSMLIDVLLWTDMRELMGFHFYSDCAGVIESVRSAAMLTLFGVGVLVVAGLSLVVAVLVARGERKK